MRKENKTLELLLKIFLAVGIVAGICVIAKIVYDKYKQRLCLICDDDYDCDFECLENDALDCDCENCEYVKHDCDCDCDCDDVVEAVEEAVEAQA